MLTRKQELRNGSWLMLKFLNGSVCVFISVMICLICACVQVLLLHCCVCVQLG